MPFMGDARTSSTFTLGKLLAMLARIAAGTASDLAASASSASAAKTGIARKARRHNNSLFMENSRDGGGRGKRTVDPTLRRVNAPVSSTRVQPIQRTAV